MKKILSILTILALLLASAPRPSEAANVQTTMHRIEQRYKEDYRLYPVSEEDLQELKKDPGVISQMKLAGYYFSEEQYDKSYPIYEKCAKEGDIQALFMQGLSGLNWRGPKPGNDKERMVYIRMIDEAAPYHPVAMYLLAVMLDNGYTVDRNKKQAAELFAQAKQKGVTEDAMVFQAIYDKAMAGAGYGRYGIKDTTGTLALATATGIPAIRPEPLDPESNPTPELRALFQYLTAQYGTPDLITGKFGSPQDIKVEKTKSGKEVQKYVYKDFTASYLNDEWVDITVKSGVRVLFNGLKINASLDDLMAVTGVGEYLDIRDYDMVMHDVTRSKAAAEFKINAERVTYMRAYKTID